MTKKHLQNFLAFAVFAAVMVFCGIGIQRNVAVPSQKPSASNGPAPAGRLSVQEVQRPTEAGYQIGAEAPIGMQRPYVAGPLVADVGQLCVFRLNDPATRADWVIVPEATCYVDSSGSSLAFASNVASKYTIIAAVVEEGVPKILTHICEYGLQPEPQPGPSPKPDPKPEPEPEPKPIVSLKDWVAQNVPEAGKSKATALASCYESAALGIENDSIRSQEAAFSVIRTATQTKIDIETWAGFLDPLAEKITEQLAGSSDVKLLGTIFSEIASGLKEVTVSDTGSVAEPEVSVPDILPFSSATCPDSTCKPINQQRRRAQ